MNSPQNIRTELSVQQFLSFFLLVQREKHIHAAESQNLRYYINCYV